jgi:hypothetical protein
VFGTAPRSSRSKKTTSLQIFSANHTKLVKLLLQKNGAAGPNSMVFMEYLLRYSPNPSFLELGEITHQCTGKWKMTDSICYVLSPFAPLPPSYSIRLLYAHKLPAARRGARRPACAPSVATYPHKELSSPTGAGPRTAPRTRSPWPGGHAIAGGAAPSRTRPAPVTPLPV